MNRTLFLVGSSNIRKQETSSPEPTATGGSRVTAELTGVLPILPYVMSDETLRQHSEIVLLGLHQIRSPSNVPVNLFNIVADADISGDLLRRVQIIEDKLQPLRCFNRPANVFKTSREQLPTTLAGIEGCLVPRVEAARPENFGELQAVCDQFACWPMIVRARGQHGGKNMVLLNEPAQLQGIAEQPWLYDGIHLIQFFDYRNKDGLYQKNRVIMVDGAAYPRHSIISDRWSIHSGSRVDLMDQDIELCVREEGTLNNLRDTGLKGLAPVFDEIYQRIGLDIFGIDFAFVDGKILVFEANACMNFLNHQYGDDNRYQYLQSHVEVLRAAVRNLLEQA